MARIQLVRPILSACVYETAVVAFRIYTLFWTSSYMDMHGRFWNEVVSYDYLAIRCDAFFRFAEDWFISAFQFHTKYTDSLILSRYVFALGKADASYQTVNVDVPSSTSTSRFGLILTEICLLKSPNWKCRKTIASFGSGFCRCPKRNKHVSSKWLFYSFSIINYRIWFSPAPSSRRPSAVFTSHRSYMNRLRRLRDVTYQSKKREWFQW